MNRQITPDVLGDLMGNSTVKQEGNKASEQVPHKAIKQESKKAPIGRVLLADVVVTAAGETEESKEKATFNLPIKLLGELEDRWAEIRKISGSKQVSKTLIVETALELAFAEFDSKKQESKFYSKLASNKAIKQ